MYLRSLSFWIRASSISCSVMGYSRVCGEEGAGVKPVFAPPSGVAQRSQSTDLAFRLSFSGKMLTFIEYRTILSGGRVTGYPRSWWQGWRGLEKGEWTVCSESGLPFKWQFQIPAADGARPHYPSPYQTSSDVIKITVILWAINARIK